MKTQKIYRGQIDDTWTEVDLTDFFKDNPKYAPKSGIQKELTVKTNKRNSNESVNCL